MQSYYIFLGTELLNQRIMIIVIASDNLFPDCILQVFPSLYSHVQWCEYSQNVRFNINVMDTSEQVEFWKKYFVMINFYRGEINIVLAFPVAWFALPQITALQSALSTHQPLRETILEPSDHFSPHFVFFLLASLGFK